MTFYGNIKYKLLNGFSKLKVQEQVWEFDKHGKPVAVDGTISKYGVTSNGKNLNLLYTFENYSKEDSLVISSGILESLYDEDSYLSIIYPSAVITNYVDFGTIGEIDFHHNIYFTEKTYHSVQHEEILGPNGLWTIAPEINETIPNNFNNPIIINSKYDDSTQQHYFYQNDNDENLFSFSMLNTINDFFIDVQGHCVAETLIIDQYITQQNLLSADYIHDNWVQELIGPLEIAENAIERKNQQLKSLNTTAVLNEEEQYITSLSNCADLYNNIGKVYIWLQEKEQYGINFFQDLSNQYDDINELINNKNLIVRSALDENNFNTSLYLYNIANETRIFNGINNENIPNMSYQGLNIAEDDNNSILHNDFNLILPNQLKQINYFFDYNKNNTSTFLSSLDGLSQCKMNITYYQNSVLKKKINKFLDFCNFMNIIFYPKVQGEFFMDKQAHIFNILEESDVPWDSEDSLFIKWAKRMRNIYNIEKSQWDKGDDEI